MTVLRLQVMEFPCSPENLEIRPLCVRGKSQMHFRQNVPVLNIDALTHRRKHTKQAVNVY